jgi:diguanylate cyclase (GGDEF)-like protein
MQDDLIELKLGRKDLAGSDGGEALLTIIDRLLALVSDVAVGNESLKATPEFRAQLRDFKALVSGSSNSTENLGELADNCLSACEDFFSRAREHALNREIEFIEIIDALRETVRLLAGQSNQFNESLIGSSQRFNRLLEIDNLQVLKQQIVVEAQDLHRVVEEKQKTDEESYSNLSTRIEKLQKRLDRAEEDAMVDALTQVANRGSFDQTLENWVDTFGPGEPSFALAMFDLDDFKKVNDTYGHQVGDRVLIGAAQILQKSIRSGDLVARYGGEEFVVLLRRCPIDQAETRFNKMISDIASTRFDYGADGASQYLQFTASCGLAEFAGNESVEGLIKRADEALYEAKRKGKNRVIVKKRSILKGLFGGGKRKNAA